MCPAAEKEEKENVDVEEIREMNAKLEAGEPAMLVEIYWRYGDPASGGGLHLRKDLLGRIQRLSRKLDVPFHLLVPDEPVGEYRVQPLGLLIMGGADIDPKFYGQAPQGTKMQPESTLRYPFTLATYRWARQRLPVLGVCYGSHFLCVAEGGSLVQHLPQAERHKHATLKLFVEPGSWLHAATGDEELVTQCNHHQGFDVVPPFFKVSARDEEGLPHAIEHTAGLPVLGLLNHPELCDHDPRNLRALRAFLDLCRAAAAR